MKPSTVLRVIGLWLLASGFALAILDTNENGLSDFWEWQHNSGELFPGSFDPQADPDGDSWSNLQEAAAGTSPFEANPPDGFIRPVTAKFPAVWEEDEYGDPYLAYPESLTVTWPTLAGKRYTLFYSSDLSSWLPVGNPFTAYGGESTYGFDIGPDKGFWRVKAEDTDADVDGLTDHEEHLAGTNPGLADSDGDNTNDHAEFIAGTDPRNQDTDFDGIPDSIDGQPLASAIAFADADGDGITDGDDADPNDPRGPAPSIAAENASGNPAADMLEGETIGFVFTVANPAGYAPTASDLALFLNGTEETESATFSALGAAAGSSQRFVFTWLAKPTADYPDLTLQNLTLRFRDPDQATTWAKLARIDVAEWEGPILAIASLGDTWTLGVNSHQGGVVEKKSVSALGGQNIRYRGPKEVKFQGGSTPLSAQIGEGMRYPVVVIKDGATVEHVFDISDPLAFPRSGAIAFNNFQSEVLMDFGIVGSMTVPSGGHGYLPAPAVAQDGGVGELFYFGGVLFHSTYSGLLKKPWGSYRDIFSYSIVGRAEDEGIPRSRKLSNRAHVEAGIRPHSADVSGHLGMPFQKSYPNTNPSSHPILPMPSGAWHRITLKVGPEAEAVSDGIRIALKRGTASDGDGGGQASPLAGWAVEADAGMGFQALTLPADGGIPVMPETDLYEKLISPEGLPLRIRRDTTVEQAHTLALELLPKNPADQAVRVTAIKVLPVDILVGDGSDIETAQDGFVIAEANPAPSVEMNVTSSALEDGDLAIRLQGTVKDSVSRFAKSAAERPQTLEFYHQGELLHSVPLDETVGDGFVFDETVEIPDALPQTYVIRAETTQNIAGNKGYDESSVSLTWEEDASAFPVLSAPLSVAFAASPDATTVDQATLYVGNGSPQAGDTASVETAAGSLTFTGDLRIPAQPADLTAGCRFEIVYPEGFTTTEIDTVFVNLEIVAPGFPKNRIAGRWIETGANTLVFRPGNQVLGNSALKTSQTANRDLRGTDPSDVEACTIRLPDLPPPLAGGSLQIVSGGTAYDLIEIGGKWYPEDPDAPGTVKRFAPSGRNMPERLRADGYAPGQGFLKFQLRYPGAKDMEAADVLVVPGEPDQGLVSASPPLAAAGAPAPQASPAQSQTPWQPGDPVSPEHIVWAYRFLNAGDDFAEELLNGYLRGGHRIVTGDFIRQLSTQVDWGDEIGDFRDNIRTISIEEDINPIHAARLLFEGLKEMYLHDEVADDFQWVDTIDEIAAFQAAAASAVLKTQTTAIAATELYLSGLGIVNEGLDWIIVVNDVAEGHWESLAAALPGISAGLVKAGGHLTIVTIAGKQLDNLDREGFLAMRELGLNGNLASAGTVFDEYGYSEFLRKVFTTDSGPVRPPKDGQRGKLKEAMEGISPRPSDLHHAHHDFPWAQKEWFARHGIDVNDPAYGRWVKKEEHGGWHGWRGGEFNAWWRAVEAEENAARAAGQPMLTKQQIIQKLIECRQQFPDTL